MDHGLLINHRAAWTADGQIEQGHRSNVQNGRHSTPLRSERSACERRPLSAEGLTHGRPVPGSALDGEDAAAFPSDSGTLDTWREDETCGLGKRSTRWVLRPGDRRHDRQRRLDARRQQRGDLAAPLIQQTLLLVTHDAIDDHRAGDRRADGHDDYDRREHTERS